MFSKNSISKKAKTPSLFLKIVWVLLSLPMPLLAQKPMDNPRTQRDVEVLRTVLQEYFKEANPDKKQLVVSRQKASVQYFTGFGLLISAPTYVPVSSRWAVKTNSFAYSITTDSDDCDCEEDEKEENAARSGSSIPKGPTSEQISSIMQGFVTNYGSLMGFVQPGERILFYYDKKEEGTLPKGAATNEKPTKPERILIEMSQADTRLSVQELTSKIKPTLLPLDKTSKPEFEIMGKIFNSSFGNSVGGTFVSSNNNMVFFDNQVKHNPNSYQLFKGLGVIYNFSVNYNKALRMQYSFAPGAVITRTMSSSDDVITEVITPDDHDGTVTIIRGDKDKIKTKTAKPEKAEKTEKAEKPAKAEKVAKPAPAEKASPVAKVDKAEADKLYAKKAEEEYDLFLTEVKNYMIEYGRTLRSLDPAERLIVAISINTWNSNALPQRVELSVLKSVLDEYDKRNVSLENAVSKIEVREQKRETKGKSGMWLENDK